MGAPSRLPFFSHLIEPLIRRGKTGRGWRCPPRADHAIAVRDARAASSPAMFSVHPERVNGVYRLKISGELDLATRETLRDELKLAEASDAKRIVLDLNDLTLIDSSGIAILVEAHQRSATNGSRFRVLLLVDGQVREVLELTGLTEILDFTD